jgi:hypothetical protein
MAISDDTQLPVLPSNEDSSEERQEKLPQDPARPFSPPADVKSSVPTDNEMSDSADVDSHQAYDEGVSNAAEVNDPGNRGVQNYNPPGYQPPQNSPIETATDENDRA